MLKVNKVVLVTGGFDPLHSGHLAYFNAAAELGSMLIVGVNSDLWLIRKKGYYVLPLRERKEVIESLLPVHKVIEYDDNDNSSKVAIRMVRELYPNSTIVFANGGDRNQSNIPEMDIDDDNIEFVFGVGGEDKKNSSSEIINTFSEMYLNTVQEKTHKCWGYFKVLGKTQGCKVKELEVLPGGSLTMQRHWQRNEFWIVAYGKCKIYTLDDSNKEVQYAVLEKHDQITIPETTWHRLENPYDEPCKIYEIQYGVWCDESDIERR